MQIKTGIAWSIMMSNSKTVFASLVLLLLVHGGLSFSCLSPCHCTGIEINCSDGELMHVPEFETINGANIVDLSSNEIEEIYAQDFKWTGIEQLQFLYLNINSIIYIQENALEIFRNLEYLDLSNNNLEIIPSRMFAKNTRLKTLKLTGNFFGRNVPAIVSPSLEHLDMSFAKLYAFTNENIANLPSLKHLNLQANNFAYMDPTIFTGYEAISLIISYNVWACNCSTIELYKWATESQGRIQIDDPIKCMTKNNVYIDMVNRTQSHIYKESCDIDEDTFGAPTIKELSQVKDNLTVTPSKAGIKSDVDEEEYYYKHATAIAIVITFLIIIIAIALGVIIGLYIAKTAKERRGRNRAFF